LLFAWRLGIASNNIAKSHVLMQWLRLATKSNIQSLIVVADSNIFIHKMVSKIVGVDNILE
jgi:hypothetical protein